MAQGLTYAASFDAVAVSAQSDLFEITAPSDAAVIVHSLYVGQTSDMGDAQAEALKIQLIRGYATSGAGGTAPTPTPLQGGFPASGSVVEANNTTLASTGTPAVVHQDVWNIQLPYQYRPTPEERIVLSPAQRLVVRLAAPADAITASGTLLFEELGG